MDLRADLTSRFLQLANSNWDTQRIHVAAELALAARCGADAEALFRQLRGLASLGHLRPPRRAAWWRLWRPESLRPDDAGRQAVEASCVPA